MSQILVPDPAGIAAAADVLRAGGIAGLPTETVYGLAADATDPDAIRAIFRAKGRPADNPLIVHLAAADEMDTVAAPVTPLAIELAERFWPGPLTLVLDATDRIPSVTRAGLTTIAVRVPAHPVMLAVIEAVGRPLAAPSANRSGRPSPTRASDVIDDLGARVPVVLDGGPCRIGVESTVVDARGDMPVVLRDGGVSREDLGVAPDATAPHVQASPGTRYRHYAPQARVDVVEPSQLDPALAEHRAAGRRVGVVLHSPISVLLPDDVTVIATVQDASALARSLYRCLLEAERQSLDVLIVEAVEPIGIGRAVMDRVTRAAASGTVEEL